MGEMTDSQRAEPDQPGFGANLVEYLVIGVPDLDQLAGVSTALLLMAERGSVRILDVVLVERTADGRVETRELGSLESTRALSHLDARMARWLTDHDIDLAAQALLAYAAGVIVVVDDRWAEPLSAAALGAGGRIVGGDRISAQRLDTVLAARWEPPKESE